MIAADRVRDVGTCLPPRGEQTAVLRVSTVTSADRVRRRHVLVVDDEPAILNIFGEMLADEGCRVTGLASVPTPREIASLAPDAIVLDLVFDGRTSGLELLRELRRDAATAVIPIVVCTALTDPCIAVSLGELAVPTPVLTKPFDLDDAIAVIRLALDRASPVGGAEQATANLRFE
jgi:DNA-binding response OmpR family regulator